MFEDISTFKVADLKRELKARNLSATGNKQELYDRLKGAFESSGPLTLKSPVSHSGLESEDEDDIEGVGDINSEILPDDLDEDTLLNPPLEEFPTSTTNSLNLLKRKSDQQDVSSSSELQPKRISLGQHSKITFDSNTPDKENTNTAPVATTSPSDEKIPPSAINTERKVIKLSGLSVQERLELRAKKFNVELPADAKLKVRAERFGLNVGTTDGGKSNAASVDPDVLKKRAERFGTSTVASPSAASSTNPGATLTSSSQADLEAKKRARAERFGLNSSSNGTTTTTAAVVTGVVKTSTTPVTSNEEVLAKRAQRFRIVI